MKYSMRLLVVVLAIVAAKSTQAVTIVSARPVVISRPVATARPVTPARPIVSESRPLARPIVTPTAVLTHSHNCDQSKSKNPKCSQ